LRLHPRGQAATVGVLKTRGIDELEGKIAEPALPFAPIAGDARSVVNEREAPPDETIEQR